MPFPALALGGPAVVAAATAAKVAAVELLPAVSSASLAAVLARLAWRKVPDWIREDASFRSSNSSSVGDLQEMERLSSVLEKLQSSISAASEKLHTPVPYLYASVLAYVQLAAQIKRIAPEVHDERFRSAGQLCTAETIVGISKKELKDALDLAILAYYVEDEAFLRKNLDPLGFELMKRSVATKPGYVGHFMAVSSEEKVLLIGVKGTSSLEDLFTDTCGRSVSYHAHLDREEDSTSRIEVRAQVDDEVASCVGDSGEFEIVSGHEQVWVEHGDDEDNHIRCHEGIFISAKRLAQQVQSTVEKMVVNGDYKLVVVGHSLGGSAASLLAIILRSRFHEISEKNLQVYAFAPPPALDHDSAIAAVPYTTSVINDADIVPRSSLANLEIFLEFLRSVSTRLEERGLCPTGPLSTGALIKKLRQGDKGELLMTLDEVAQALEMARDKIELRHPDHLYVPGRVLLLYENWSVPTADDEESKENNGNSESSIKVSSTRAKRQVYCVDTDGTAAVLRLFEIDGYRMLGDHTCGSYTSNVQAFLSQDDT